jgi:RimJ/RimL family protein N-acetyltransferase
MDTTRTQVRARHDSDGSHTSVVVRPAVATDVGAVVAAFSRARCFMAAHGNPTQWAGTYPSADDVLRDISLSRSYVCERDGMVVGTFALIPGDDPTYRVIEEGEWSLEVPYGTVHRLASAGICPGVSRACFDFCKVRFGYLRADTHADNAPMQGALVRNGFVRRGIIHLGDGAPRLAYDCVVSPRP